MINSHVKQWNLDCPSTHPKLINACRYCVITLPCTCSLTVGQQFIAPTRTNCLNNSLVVSLKYPVNLASLMHFFSSSSIQAHNFSTIYDDVPTISFPKFQINSAFDVSNSLTNLDSSEIDLQKLSEKLKQSSVYHNPIDSLYDMIQTNVDTHTVSNGLVYGLIIFMFVLLASNVYLFYRVFTVSAMVVALTPKTSAFKLIATDIQVTTKSVPNTPCSSITTQELLCYILMIILSVYFITRIARSMLRCIRNFNSELALSHFCVLNNYLSQDKQYCLVARLDPDLSTAGYSVLLKKLRICPTHVVLNGKIQDGLVKFMSISTTNCCRSVLHIEWQPFEIMGGGTSFSSQNLITNINLPFGYKTIIPKVPLRLVFLVGRDAEYHTIPIHETPENQSRSNIYPSLN